jgi:uncharacterized protein YjbI with pentapeptide repeats
MHLESSGTRRGIPRVLTTVLLLLASSGPSAHAGDGETPHGAPKKHVAVLGTGPYACPHCDLEGLNLAGRDLTDSNLTGANLRGADFRGAILDGISLVGADLENANFDRAKLSCPRAKKAHLSRTNLRGATFQDVELFRADLQFADLSGTNFGGADLSHVVFGPAIRAGMLPDGRKTSFRGARLRREFELDEATMDLGEVRWIAPPSGTPIADGSLEETVCGKADLSGLTSRIYVSTTGTDSDSCGASYAEPCRTIPKGIERCAADGCGVLVAWGQYTPKLPVTLTSGKSLYGGCLPKRLAQPDYFSVIMAPPFTMEFLHLNCLNSPALYAVDVDLPTRVQGFQLVGPPGSNPEGFFGVSSTHALCVSHSTALTLADVEILAGAATAGSNATCRKGGLLVGGPGGDSVVAAFEQSTVTFTDSRLVGGHAGNGGNGCPHGLAGHGGDAIGLLLDLTSKFHFDNTSNLPGIAGASGQGVKSYAGRVLLVDRKAIDKH